MSDNFVASAAVYDNANDAKADFATLHDAGLRDITAALVTKSEQGRLHVHEKTHAGKVGAATGVIGGAILGTIFPLPARRLGLTATASSPGPPAPSCPSGRVRTARPRYQRKHRAPAHAASRCARGPTNRPWSASPRLWVLVLGCPPWAATRPLGRRAVRQRPPARAR